MKKPLGLEMQKRRDEVRRLWLKGLTSAQIVKQTGYQVKFVSENRPRSLKVRDANNAFKITSAEHGLPPHLKNMRK
jgi:hypothetical protein